MNTKNQRQIDYSSRKIIVAVTFLGIVIAMFAVGLGAFREWRFKQSISLIEGSQYVLEYTRQQSGNYSERRIYHWSEKSISVVRDFYAGLIIPSANNGSPNSEWTIAAWQGSQLNENPIRNVISTHTDLCDYRIVFNCMTITLIDNDQSALSETFHELLGFIPGNLDNDYQNGTLIMFSYMVPEPS